MSAWVWTRKGNSAETRWSGISSCGCCLPSLPHQVLKPLWYATLRSRTSLPPSTALAETMFRFRTYLGKCGLGGPQSPANVIVPCLNSTASQEEVFWADSTIHWDRVDSQGKEVTTTGRPVLKSGTCLCILNSLHRWPHPCPVSLERKSEALVTGMTIILLLSGFLQTHCPKTFKQLQMPPTKGQFTFLNPASFPPRSENSSVEFCFPWPDILCMAISAAVLICLLTSVNFGSGVTEVFSASCYVRYNASWNNSGNTVPSLSELEDRGAIRRTQDRMWKVSCEWYKG